MSAALHQIMLDPARRDPRGVVGLGLALSIGLVLVASWAVLAPLGALRLAALAACGAGAVASAQRARRRVEHALVFDAEAALLTGFASLFARERRLPYLRIRELERSREGGHPLLVITLERAWRPVCVGGPRAAAGAVEAAHRELRARIAALADGSTRLARIDAARRAPVTRPPWVTLAGVGSFAVLFAALGGPDPLRFATCELLLLALGLSAEGCVGSLHTLRLLGLASATGLLCAWAWGGGVEGTAVSLAFGLVGLLAYLRAFRSGVLPLTLRPAVDASLGIGLALLLAAARAAEPAALATFGVALVASPLLLRGWPAQGAPN